MMNLTKENPPEHIEVGGKAYRIKTWFKYWLRFQQICNGKDEERNFDFLFVDEIPEDKVAALAALMAFASPQSLLPRSFGEKGPKILDYTVDADLIYAAFVQQYGIDLMTGKGVDGKPLHWHKFLALMDGLRETKLTDVMDLRSYDSTDRTTYEQWREKSKETWSLEGLGSLDDGDAARMLEEFNERFE